MSAMFKEFRDFAMRGNVVDLAVGIIIGGAFGKIVSALVENVIMPPIGVLVGGVNFRDLGVVLKVATENSPAVVLKYGIFIQSIVDFLIVAFAVFVMIKAISALKKKREEAPVPAPAPSVEQKLLTEIRDILKAK